MDQFGNIRSSTCRNQFSRSLDRLRQLISLHDRITPRAAMAG